MKKYKNFVILAVMAFTGCTEGNKNSKAEGTPEKEVDYGDYFQGMEGTAVFY